MPKIIVVNLVLKPLLGLRGQKSHTLKLPSNSSTGYAWKREENCGPSIISTTNHYDQFPGPPGTGGEEVWVFTAIGKGKEIVKLVYAQTYDGDVQDELEIHFSVS